MCKVDAEKADASVEADAVMIKKHIMEQHESFEYVNETVEQALWCEVMKYLDGCLCTQPRAELQSVSASDCPASLELRAAGFESQAQFTCSW